MNFLNTVLRPVEIKILSTETINDLKSKIAFFVKFEIQFLFNTKNMRFETIGTTETVESISEKILMEILEKTDYQRYLDLNMKNKMVGAFDYLYLYQENWLIINYRTF